MRSLEAFLTPTIMRKKMRLFQDIFVAEDRDQIVLFYTNISYTSPRLMFPPKEKKPSQESAPERKG